MPTKKRCLLTFAVAFVLILGLFWYGGIDLTTRSADAATAIATSIFVAIISAVLASASIFGKRNQ